MNHNDKKIYLDSVKNSSDRELLEEQTYYAMKTAQHTKRIMNNVVFFFWFAILGSFASYIAYHIITG